MREIKCRVWNGEQMTYLPTMIVDDFSIGFTTKDEFYVDINTHHPTPGLEVTWFTGLKDKNGVEIYEGDIVKAQIKSSAPPIIVTDQVIYSNSKAQFRVGYYSFDDIYFSNIEVIGNIYENKELLK